MSRGYCRERLVSNTTGLPLANAVVTVREPGTTTALAATMYAALTGGTTVSNPITTGTDGVVSFYLDVPQDVDFRVVAAGYPDATISSVKVHYDQGDLVSKTGTQTLTNKTLTSPALSSPTLTAPTVSSGQTLLPDGTVSLPAWAYGSDPNTGGRSVSADYQALVVGGQDAIRFKKGSKFSQIGIGNVGEPGPGGDDNIVHIHHSSSGAADGDIIALAVELTTEASSGGGGSIPDSGAISAYVYQTTAGANAAIRAGEFQVIRGHASAGAHANASAQAIEAAIHTLAAGNGTNKTGVIHLGSYDATGFAGGVAADYCLRIWGARGYIRGIIQEDTAGNLIFTTSGADGSIVTAGSTTTVGVKNSGKLVLGGAITDTIAADQNNYAPTGIASAAIVQVTATGAQRTITGFAVSGAEVPQAFIFVNVGSQNIVLAHNSGSSSAGNLINTHTGADFLLAPAEGVLVFRTAALVWRTLGFNAS